MPTTRDSDTSRNLDSVLSRVLHVPLTDSEWLALRRIAFESEVTLGTLTATALHRAYPLTPKEPNE